jgi:chemotaxis protein CheY-P-specific phosphatase CheC
MVGEPDGVSPAALSFGQISREAWTVSRTVLSDGPADRFRAVMGGSIQPHLGAYLPMQDRSPLAVLVIFPAKSATALAKAFTSGYGAKVSQLPNLDQLAVSEIANILAHALAGALADALGTMFILASPQVTAGSKLTLLDAALEHFKGKERFLMVSQLSIATPVLSAECSLAFRAEDSLMARLFEGARP